MQNYIYFSKKTSFLLFFIKKYEYPNLIFNLSSPFQKFFVINNVV